MLQMFVTILTAGWVYITKMQAYWSGANVTTISSIVY